MICDRKAPLELKEDFYCITIRIAMLYEIEYRVAKSQQESKLNVVERDENVRLDKFKWI